MLLNINNAILSYIDNHIYNLLCVYVCTQMYKNKILNLNNLIFK